LKDRAKAQAQIWSGRQVNGRQGS